MKARLGLALATVALGATEPARAVEQARHHIDNQELFTLRSLKPTAVTFIEQGEAELAAGDVPGALDAFRKAEGIAPESRLAARRKCQALALLGRRVEAMEACERTMQLGASPLDSRALVFAITSGTGAPTPEELGDAQLLSGVAMRRLPAEPWGYAAQCDVLARLGDTKLLSDCTARLTRIDPNHWEARRAASRFTPSHARVWLGLGWGAILAAGLGTAAHALRGRIGRRFRRAGAGALAALALGLSSGQAHADSANASMTPAEPSAADPGEGKYPINDADPAANVPTAAQRDADPLEFGYFLINLTNKAGLAEQHKDYRAAVKFYLALAKAVPDEAVAFSKLCQYEELLNEPAKAIEACRVAVTLHGATVGDYARFAKLILSKEGKLSQDDERGVRGLIDYLKKQGADPDVVRQVECPFALRLGDAKGLEACAREFERQDPKSQTAVTYRWALALAQGDLTEAARLVKSAESAGIQPVGIRDMQRAISEARVSKWRHALVDWKTGAGLLVALLALGGWVGLRAVRRGQTAPTTGGRTA